MKTLHLAVIMTCHNRCAKTLACLEALFKQEISSDVEIQVYLVDDGSTDGTGEAVRTNYPEVIVIQGNGNLFWNRGMRLAFSEAMKSDYDYYLWLNDDTLLYPKAIDTLMATSQYLIQQGHTQTIVVGSTQDPITGLLSYGGVINSSWWHPLKFHKVEPGEEVKPCLTVNGNCVLICRKVVQVVGNLDSSFIHSTGDFDYGLRNHHQGGSSWIAPGYIGTCKLNDLANRHLVWDEPSLNLRQRWQKINHPLCLPISEWRVYAGRHGGLFWPIYWLFPYIRLIVKSVLIF
ncbi:MAG: glycosyltransferase family 2 protein [Nostoc sp. TH1S01]|nr:glycosyltransferase family 2 protein [Nostoc sp. TH1S01]